VHGKKAIRDSTDGRQINMEREDIFGLVNIPVQVFSAVQKEDYTTFDQLCNKGHKIKYKKCCSVEEREVLWSEIKKGYEITKNNYVVLEKEDIDKIKLKSTKTLEIK
jgi:DNA end-binding protein Ku